MEDGPESLEGSCEYGGRTYRLEERDSEVWRVYDGEKYLPCGAVAALHGEVSRRGERTGTLD